MREIKFRAWDSVQDKMLPVERIDFRNDVISLDEGDNSVSDSSEMFILMQYTDVKDVDGQEVYENDIVQFAIFDYNGADTQYTGAVKFSDGQWQLWKSADDPYYGSDGPFNMHMVWYNDDGFKVIGNTFENPDLLPKAPESTESPSNAGADTGSITN